MAGGLLSMKSANNCCLNRCKKSKLILHSLRLQIKQNKPWTMCVYFETHMMILLMVMKYSICVSYSRSQSYSRCHSRCRRHEPLQVTQLSQLWLGTCSVKKHNWEGETKTEGEGEIRVEGKRYEDRGHKRKRRWVNDSVLISLGRRCWRTCLMWSWETRMRGWVGEWGGTKGIYQDKAGLRNCTEASLQ